MSQTGLITDLFAGSGAVCLRTGEERRAALALARELPDNVEIASIDAPGGMLVDVRGAKDVGEIPAGLGNAYRWVADAPNRVLLVYDYHTLVNNVGHWRTLSNMLPQFRSPHGKQDGDNASLVVFVGPNWEFIPDNVLRGSIPVRNFPLPLRAELQMYLEDQFQRPFPPAAIDALCGLKLFDAEQAVAEVLARHGDIVPASLRERKREALRSAGLEVLSPIALDQYGGFSGFTRFAAEQVVPWIDHPKLAIRAMLAAGVPGVGKSYGARVLAGMLECDCVLLDMGKLKGSLVGQSRKQLDSATDAIDAASAESNLVVLIDEADKIAFSGNDGGASSEMASRLLTWMQERTSRAIVQLTVNRLDGIDSALQSRCQARFWYDLPTRAERKAIARIHYARLDCMDPESSADFTAERTEGFSNREIAEIVCPSVARLTHMQPMANGGEVIADVCKRTVPASKSQGEQLKSMREQGKMLTPANDPADVATTKRRTVNAGAA